MLLSRPPLLTRELSSFEKAFYLYQRRLNERLVLPFTRYFYYQKGTPGDLEWKRKIKERLTPSRDIGKYTGYGKESWNDELLIGDETSEPERQIEALVDSAQVDDGTASSDLDRKRDTSITKPSSRTTDADRAQDTRSLNRALTRTLYLLVKRPGDGKAMQPWSIPGAGLHDKESLHAVRSFNNQEMS